MPQPNSKTDKLRKASDHLWYEIWMFQSLVPGMASDIAGRGVMANALLESFAIHVRALIHFFYADSRQRDDVLAEDFFEDPSAWRSSRPAKTSVLTSAKKRADKEVAHLTYSRQKVTPDKKPWHYIPIYDDLQATIAAFFNLVPGRLLGERWADTISHTRSKNGAA